MPTRQPSLGREPVRKQVWKEHGYASQNRPPLPSIAPRLQPCLSNHTNVWFVQTVRICLPNALLDVQQVLVQTVAIAAFAEPIVHGRDSWCSKQISNVDKRNFPPMFLCDMPQPFLARVDSRCAKFRATDPSNKSSLELQPRIGSYVESGYWVWPYRHYECTGAQLQNKRLVSRWHRRISICFWWKHFCSEKSTCWQRRRDLQIANDNQYPELPVWNRLQKTCNLTICDPIPLPLPW